MIADKPTHDEAKGQGVPVGCTCRQRGRGGCGGGHTGVRGQRVGGKHTHGGARQRQPHQPLSCEPSSNTPTTTDQKSEVSSERFMTVAVDPAPKRCVSE